MNQTVQSGSAFLTEKKRRHMSMLALCLSLFLVGSCNESADVFNFSMKPANLQNLNKVELVRYGYALQRVMLQSSENIKKLNADDVKLALSTPDFQRQNGHNNVWQYRTESCVLDIYWKDKKESRPVAHFEFRQRRSVLDGTQAVVDPVQWQCVQTIIQDRRQKIDAGFNDVYADNLSLKAHKS